MKGLPSDVRTAVAQSRVDIRTLAALHKFYQENGIVQANRSALINAICEDFLSLLVRGGNAVRIDKTSEAYDYLYAKGIMRSIQDEPARVALLKKISDETLATEIAEVRGISTTDTEIADALKRYSE